MEDKDIVMGKPPNNPCLGCGIQEPCEKCYALKRYQQEMLVYQQKILAFKAGIKEVVEWGLETCPHDLFGEGTHCYKRACDECWKEKKKEWGIE